MRSGFCVAGGLLIVESDQQWTAYNADLAEAWTVPVEPGTLWDGSSNGVIAVADYYENLLIDLRDGSFTTLTDAPTLVMGGYAATTENEYVVWDNDGEED